MADIRNCSREFLTKFIQLYQSFSSLWWIKSKEYCDRDEKAKAYEQLVGKYREIDAEANREMVVKKINSIRSVYRKDKLKYSPLSTWKIASHVSGINLLNACLEMIVVYTTSLYVPPVAKNRIVAVSISCGEIDALIQVSF